MLAETIIGAEVENINRLGRVKAVVGIEGTQLALNGIIDRLRKLGPIKVPIANPAERKRFSEEIVAIRSEIISNGLMIDDYLFALESIWYDYDKSSPSKMN